MAKPNDMRRHTNGNLSSETSHDAPVAPETTSNGAEAVPETASNGAAPTNLAEIKVTALISMLIEAEGHAARADELNEHIATRLHKAGVSKIKVGSSERRVRGINGSPGRFRLYEVKERQAKGPVDLDAV